MLSCFHFLFGKDGGPAYLPPANCAYHDPPPGTAADYSDNPSVFGKILRGELPSRDYREDAELLAFNDRTPKARLHALVIPKRYFKSVYDLTSDDVGMLRDMRQMGLELMEEHEPEALANDDYCLCFHIPPFYSRMSVQDVPRDTMRCILAAAHGDDVDALYMRDDYPKPKREAGEVLIKVHACALAPGDVRVLRGHCDYWQEPPKFPYIPGGDLSGTVVEAGAGSRFHEGDAVMAMFELPRPLNGLAEFISVKEALVEMAPKSVPLMLASTLPSSALSAMIATNKYVKQGDRILVLGGGGGVGTFFVQMAKAKGASYIAVTSSTDKEWLMPALGADIVVDYTKSVGQSSTG
ncbi:hypothetical protein ACHAXT_008385 [Thalassiosira profunda]